MEYKGTNASVGKGECGYNKAEEAQSGLTQGSLRDRSQWTGSYNPPDSAYRLHVQRTGT